MKKLQAELGISFIHVTHSQEEALGLADEIIVMNNAVEQAGTAQSVFNEPKPNLWRGFLAGITCLICRMAALLSAAMRLRILPGTNALLSAQITAVEYQGIHVSLTAKVFGGQEVTILMADSAFLLRQANPARPLA